MRNSRSSVYNRLPQVLLVEDNPTDVSLVQEAFGQVDRRHDLHIVADGAAALDYLTRRGGFERAPRPDLIVLDLGLPKCGGFEVLERVKGDPLMRSIPVVILTQSKEQGDVWRSYHQHANAYMVKPERVADFLVALRRLAQFYLGDVLLPPHEPVTH
ncbi:response regulator [Deinococcus peraridilitoris]|uniref:CheY-like receiver domain-containing protein n=1 Tax=Deinococcus peraridilitoris (strain DSM 19664 / LMG 22246 / CIP 109416 / KR-200) TaxID=937777 RepID=K9ZZ59_DEIPD|nr:response regulator [Deinococcus peraridilitoris]AFZ66933.1 CheY-like receiver domain-containing protein [Deinococcus peraridilitoris DSM 19664]